MRITASLLALTALLGASQAMAQAAPGTIAAPAPKLEVGATVFDPKGGEVGKIDAISGQNVVVATPSNKVTLGANAFAQWPQGLTIAMTQAELDAAATQAAAKTAAALEGALVAGAPTHSLGGSKLLGTVKSVEADAVVLTTERGDIQLPKTAFTVGPAGLSVAMSAEQFDQALNQALPPKS